MVLNGRLGIVQTFGSEAMSRDALPAVHAIGELVQVRTDTGDTAVLLKTPFDIGRWLVQQIQTPHEQVGDVQPPAGEYELYNDLIWQFGRPSAPPEVVAYFAEPDEAVVGAQNADWKHASMPRRRRWWRIRPCSVGYGKIAA